MRALIASAVVLMGCEATLDLGLLDASVAVDRSPPREVWTPDDAPPDDAYEDPFAGSLRAPPFARSKELHCDGVDDPDDLDDEGVDEGCDYDALVCDACAPPTPAARPRIARAALLRGDLAFGLWREGFMQSDNRMMFAVARVTAAGLTPVMNGTFGATELITQPTTFASAELIDQRVVASWIAPFGHCIGAACASGMASVGASGDATSTRARRLEGGVVSNLVEWRDGCSPTISRCALTGAVGPSGRVSMWRFNSRGEEIPEPRSVIDLGRSGAPIDLRVLVWRQRLVWAFTVAEGGRTPMYLSITDLRGEAMGPAVRILPWGAFLSETQNGVFALGDRIGVVANVPGHGVMLARWSPDEGVAAPIFLGATRMLAAASDGVSIFACVCPGVGCSLRRFSERGVRLSADVDLPPAFSDCDVSADRGSALVTLGLYGTSTTNPRLVLVRPGDR